MSAGPAAFFLAIPLCLWTAKLLAGWLRPGLFQQAEVQFRLRSGPLNG
jgi:hypothetical protein